MAPSSQPRRFHVVPNPYCILCRRSIPGATTLGRDPPDGKFDDWEVCVVGLCNLSKGNRFPPEIYAFEANLKHAAFLYNSLLLVKHKKKEEESRAIRFSYDPTTNREYDLSRPLFFSHLCCWKVVSLSRQQQLHQQPHMLCLLLYKFAQQTQPVLPSGSRGREPSVLARSPDLSLIFKETDLGRLLVRCYTRLPGEMQEEVVRHLSYDFTSSLLLASQNAISLLGLVNDRPVSSGLVRSLLQGSSNTCNSGWLCATTTSIFGQSYLHRIEFVHRDEAEVLDSGIPVHINTVRGVKFVLGTYGLRAIRIVYQDSSTSPWLGEPSNGMYGITFGDFRLLRIMQDDLKVIRVGFTDMDDDRRSLSWPAQALWNVDPELFGEGELQIVDTERHPGQLLHYSGWRLCQYLPLEDDDGNYATGMTVYCDVTGISAIIVHGKKSDQTVGRRQGCPIYFPLGSGERITFSSLCTIDHMRSALLGPYLLINTNHHRSAFFGPIMTTPNSEAKWSVVTPESLCRVTGFIIDTLTVRHSHFQSIGAAVDASTERPNAPISPPTVTTPRTGTRFLVTHFLSFLSTAKLSGVRKLQVRKVKQHCTGLHILHHDGTTEVLGRWDPSTGTITDIYDHLDGPIKSLSFHYSKDEELECHVIGISVGDQEMEGHRTFIWQISEAESLAWWFTTLYDDIRPWDGGLVNLEQTVSRWQAQRIQ